MVGVRIHLIKYILLIGRDLNEELAITLALVNYGVSSKLYLILAYRIGEGKGFIINSAAEEAFNSLISRG